MFTRIIVNLLFLSAGLQLFSQELPDQFDLRDYEGESFVTPVREQQGYNSWSHAVYGSMESNLMITNTWELSGELGLPNLAEYHLDWWNGFNSFNNSDVDDPTGTGVDVHDGGNFRMAAAYLTRGDGSVRQQDGQSYEMPPQQMNEDYQYFMPRHIIWLNAGDDLEKINFLKRSIIDYGALASVISYDQDYIDFLYNHYQPPSSDDLPNQAITIVGWDDRKVTPASTRGAWICKNSWGSSWGNNGYFYVSYYDKYAGKHPQMGAVLFADVRKPQYDHIYYHDYHGWVDTLHNTIAVYNHFQASESEFIKSVSFVTTQDSVNYLLQIYKEFEDGMLSDLQYSHDGEVEFAGYHQTDLSPVVNLAPGDSFYIFLRISDGGYAYDRTHVPFVLNAQVQNPVVSAAAPGQSAYLTSSGWKDFYYYEDPSGFNHSGNFCIKAYTMSNPGTSDKPAKTDIKVEVSLQQEKLTVKQGKEFERISIYNLQGQLLLNEPLSKAGMWQQHFSRKGIFIYRLTNDSKSVSGKISSF